MTLLDVFDEEASRLLTKALKSFDTRCTALHTADMQAFIDYCESKGWLWAQYT